MAIVVCLLVGFAITAVATVLIARVFRGRPYSIVLAAGSVVPLLLVLLAIWFWFVAPRGPSDSTSMGVLGALGGAVFAWPLGWIESAITLALDRRRRWANPVGE